MTTIMMKMFETHPVKAAQFLVFLMKAEMFLILRLIGSSFSESDRTP